MQCKVKEGTNNEWEGQLLKICYRKMYYNRSHISVK